MSKGSFVLQSPPDGGPNLVVPIEWRLARESKVSFAAAMMVGSERDVVAHSDGRFSLY